MVPPPISQDERPIRASVPPPASPSLAPPGATASMLPTVITLPARRSFTPWLIALGVLAIAFVFREALALGAGAFAIAYVFAPLVRRLVALHVPRTAAIALVLLALAAVLGAAVATLLPELARQVESLLKSLPEYSAAIQRDWLPWLRVHLHLRSLPTTTEGLLSHLGVDADGLGRLVNNTLGYTVAASRVAFTALVVLALTFYFLLAFDPFLDGAFDLVPHRARDRVGTVAREIDATLRHFIQGQLLAMLILGALYAVGLGLLGVPAGWAIGVFAGLISFVPYLGFFAALGLALVMTTLAGRGVPGALEVSAVMVAVHIVDLMVITPRVVGGRARISPIVVILSLIAGGSVFGFVGVLVAIPTAAVARVLLGELVAYYKTTPFYLTDGPQGALQSVPFTAPDGLASSLPAALFAQPSLSTTSLSPTTAKPSREPPAPPDPSAPETPR